MEHVAAEISTFYEAQSHRIYAFQRHHHFKRRSIERSFLERPPRLLRVSPPTGVAALWIVY